MDTDEGKLAVGVDLGLSASAPLPRWPLRLMVLLELQDPGDRGTGSEEEHRRLQANTVRKRTLSWLTVGRARFRDHAHHLARCVHA